jgi:nucleotide-binding universal stress UspA family protein
MAKLFDKVKGVTGSESEKAVIEAIGSNHDHVKAELVYGAPKKILRALSNDADQVVVGAQGHNAVIDGALGSISSYLVAHAGCPVTVVRARPAA